MEVTNEVQLHILFLTCGIGFLLGAYYDVFRVARLIMRSSPKKVFVGDLLFFASSAIITFLFALTVTGGIVRLYMFFGLLVGFFAYYFTIGRLVMRCARTVVNWMLKAWRLFWHTAFAPLRWGIGCLRAPFRKIVCFFEKRLKKGLKPKAQKVYNEKK